MQQETDDTGAENLGEASTKLQSSETNNMENENHTGALTISQSEKNNNEVGNHAETSSKGQSSQKGTPKSLRAKSKAIKKSSAGNSMKSKIAKGTQKIQGKNRKKKKKKNVILQGNKESRENEQDGANNLNSNGKTVCNVEHIEEGQEIAKNQGRIVGSNKGQKNQKSDAGNEKNKEKPDAKGKIKRDKKKKEKLGGLIFMCSAKTKPDCFRYRVMGVTMNKKELILGVKPGLKLFLYDFDLKLMYGIYEASSSGGVKLEPKAFGGAFPVQVRFIVHKDCFPVAERVFKKAIKDNYNEKNKFKTELTVRQVRKLSALFRPSAVPVRSPPGAIIQDREVYERARELWAHSDREVFAGGNHDGKSYNVLSDERDWRVDYRELGFTNREGILRDLFMSEREYRTYGLLGERRNLTPSHHISSTLDPYQKNQEREHLLRQTDPMYRDTIPLQRGAVLVDPLYLTHRTLQSYNPIGRQELPPATTSIAAAASASSSALTALDPHARDPYYTCRYGTSSLDAYLPPPRRDEVSSGSYYVDSRRDSYLYETDPLRRWETDQVDKLYSTYAADTLSNYNRAVYFHGAKPETAPPPVSSRYSFAGPSVSYR